MHVTDDKINATIRRPHHIVTYVVFSKTYFAKKGFENFAILIFLILLIETNQSINIPTNNKEHEPNV